jgi:hypothetical protein
MTTWPLSCSRDTLSPLRDGKVKLGAGGVLALTSEAANIAPAIAAVRIQR